METLDTHLISNADFILALASERKDFEVKTNNKGISYYNVAAGFDIETSSFYIADVKNALMYEWTFGIGYLANGEFRRLKTYGRTWEEWKCFIGAVSKILHLDSDYRLVVYVHNLPYEWQWMRKHFVWDKVFFLDIRKPVYAVTNFGVEFRCSLKLSNKSLANTAKDLLKYKAKKMVGDLDYSLIRTPRTPLSQTELGYCEADIDVILCYIQEKIERDGDITKIPLTNTGYVRRYCKDACFRKSEEEEGQIHQDAESDEEFDIEPSGVSRTERMLSRRIYPCQCSPSRDDPYESWFVRLFEFLSGVDDSVSVSDGKGRLSRYSNNF